MDIRDRGYNKAISKKEVERNQRICKSVNDTIVFSFKYLTTSKKYKGFLKDEQISSDFFSKLQLISSLTWEQFHLLKRQSGYELMTCGEVDAKIVNGVNLRMTADEKIYVVRFNSQKSRIFIKRGSKCPRIANILAIDTELSAYKH